MMLASSFAPIGDVAAWWLLLVSAIASVLPALRGHWLGPLLAAPAILGIWFVDRSIAAGYGRGDPRTGQWLAFIAPFIVGLLSIGVWAWMFWQRVRRDRTGG
jgi:hypothetical protein